MHLHTLRQESCQKETEPNILTLCSAAVCRAVAFRLPRFFASGCAFAPKASFPTFTVPFLRRGFSPRSSVLCVMTQSRVPKYAHIYFYRFIMNLFVPFVNRLTKRWQKRKTHYLYIYYSVRLQHGKIYLPLIQKSICQSHKKSADFAKAKPALHR